MATRWRFKSAALKSKGEEYKERGLVRSLADLHEARSVHDSQFFTPAAIVDVIWRIVDPICDEAIPRTVSGRIPILDNSIGSGALIANADPDRHAIYGSDIDANCVRALEEDLDEAGFFHELTVGDMAELRVSGMGVAVVNPPFSIHLASPVLEAGTSTCFGKFGPDTHALSHEYALEQALRASQVIVAVLPTTFAHQLTNPRLAQIIDLPGDAFKEQGANVYTSIAVFDSVPRRDPVVKSDLAGFEVAELLSRLSPLSVESFRPKIRHYTVRSCAKSITTPVTGDCSVRVYRSGRNIRLGFQCGFTEARVLNGLLVDFVDNSLPHRIPRRFDYEGEGKLYLPFYFASDDPLGSLNDLAEEIKGLGGVPAICPQLIGYVRRKAKYYADQSCGYARWIESAELSDNFGCAEKGFAANPAVFPSPIIKKGERIEILSMDGAEWKIRREDGAEVLAVRERVEANVKISRAQAEWKRIGTSMAERFPDKARNARARCRKSGALDYCSWGYQEEDLIDSLCSKKGTLITQQQGLGKTRMAFGIASTVQSGKCLIVVLPQLLDQFIEQAEEVGVFLHPIRRASDITRLSKVNIITTTKLRCKLRSGSKRTFAKALRNRFGTIILDEADLLRNTKTKQSQAITQLGGFRRFALSGTPVANYPRNFVGVASWVFGDGNILQPYSADLPYPEPCGLSSASYTRRGIDVFADKFVTMEWVTNEFREDMQSGAKREIPAIRNLSEYRQYVSRLMIRRLRDEPMVAKHFPSIEIKEQTHTIEWDNAHLGAYLGVAEDFKEWFAQAKGTDKNISLVVLLARIGAVIAACNQPQYPTKSSRGFLGRNTKVEATISLLKQEAAAGRKSIVFLDSPKQAKYLSQQAEASGISNIVLSGDIDQKTRTSQLNDEFKQGKAMVCFATFGVARYGLNIPEAETCVFYNRKWSHTDEQQALFRMLRPQQARDVTIHYMHLRASIDEYMAQMVEYKRDAALSGLDFAEPATDSENFLHLDHILGSFVNRLKDLYGVKTSGELRGLLAS